MFTTISGYFLFIIPATILLALGIIYEEKLVEIEEMVWCKIKMFFRGRITSSKKMRPLFSSHKNNSAKSKSLAAFDLSA
ncbi:MAG: hypothetical protein R3Y27_02350 [Clostridia bacterium]